MVEMHHLGWAHCCRVKIGSRCHHWVTLNISDDNFKDDYFVTPDQLWVPLRWIAPEIVDEVHGNLLTVDQTKSSNVW